MVTFVPMLMHTDSLYPPFLVLAFCMFVFSLIAITSEAVLLDRSVGILFLLIAIALYIRKRNQGTKGTQQMVKSA